MARLARELAATIWALRVEVGDATMSADIPFKVERQDDRPRGWSGHCVYVIASAKDDIVKIGFSSDPLGRLKALQIGRPHELRTIAGLSPEASV